MLSLHSRMDLGAASSLALDPPAASAHLAALAGQHAQVAELGREAVEGGDLQALLDHAMAVVARGLQVPYCCVGELSGDAMTIRFTGTRGWPVSAFGATYENRPSSSQACYAIATGEAVVVEELARETRFAVPASFTELGLVSGASVVIRGARGKHGALNVHTTERRTFYREDVDFLQSIANLLAAAIERRIGERELRTAYERYCQVFDRHPQPLFLFERSTLQILEANDAAVQLYGWSREELRTMSALDLRPAEDRQASIEANARAEHDIRAGWRNVKKDGTIFEIEGTRSALPGVGPDVWLAAVTDVSAKRTTERALRASEALHRRIVETADEGIWMIDVEGHITFANRKAGELFREAPEALVGRSIFELVPPALVEPARAAVARQREGHAETTEVQYLRRDGSTFDARLTATPLHDDAGVFQGALAMITDLTAVRSAEQRRGELEAELRQSQKLEAVGRLAGSVAHDFNNMLSVVMSAGQLLEDELSPSDPRSEEVQAIRAAATKAGTLTRQLLTFSRKSQAPLRPVDLGAVLEGILPLARRALTEEVRLETRFARGLPPVLGDPGLFEQVVMNLVMNARDAIDGCGAVTISTARGRVPPESRERPAAGLVEGAYVVLSVRDTGSGMTPEVRERIFEPFFTTKAPGKGTGLGLATVYGIVKQAKGGITVESTPGEGTVFEIWLPAVEGQGERPSAPEPRSGPSERARERVLIVEDDPAVGKMAKRVLEASGYRVTVVPSPESAVMITAGLDKYDLFLLDLVLPSQFGTELAPMLLERQPNAALLYMSGYTGERIRGMEHETSAVLSKPFTRDSLEKAVRAALDARRRTPSASLG